MLFGWERNSMCMSESAKLEMGGGEMGGGGVGGQSKSTSPSALQSTCIYVGNT